jgi:cell division protein FtsI/penicillin-binding protein 2
MSETYKRWYDYDPTLLSVINLLRDYQDELHSQATYFLEKVEEQVSKEAIERFYEMVKPINGKRWYDKDPVISKTVELLRVVPVEIQKQAAENFIKTLEEKGIEVSVGGETNE